MSMNALKGKKFLILDDEQSMLNIVGAVLTNFNAESVGVTSVQKMMQAAQFGDFDFIILDRHMPDADGNRVLQDLKTGADTKEIPVIMLTAETRVEEIQSSIKAGAVGYIAKPFKAKDFYTQLVQIIERDSQYSVG